MAEVLDIIHKITYEANEDVILSLNKAFGNQFKQLQELYTEQKRLEDLREKSGEKDIVTQTALTAAYNKNKQAIDNITVALGREFAANEKLQTSLQKTTKNLSSLSFAGSQLLREAPAFTYSIQTGILALSNNIPILVDQLTAARKAGATTTEIFKSLGSSIFGITGLITIAVSALTIFGDKLFRTGEAAKEADTEYKKFLDTVANNTKQALKTIDEQISREKVLLGIIQSSTASQEQRNKAFKELKSIFPSLKDGGLTDTDIATLNRQIAARERSNALSKNEVLVLEQVRVKNEEIAKQQLILNSAIAANQRAQAALAGTTGDARDRREAIALERQQTLNKEQQRFNDLVASRSALLGTASKLQKEATDEAVKAGNAFFGRAKEDTIFKKAAKDVKELNLELRSATIDIEKLVRLIQDVEDRANPNSANFKGLFSKTPIRGTVKTVDPILPAELTEQEIEEQNNLIKEFYTQAFNDTISGLQAIYDAKLRFYDMELSAQQSRIEQATLLAERGNAQVLEDELNTMRTLEGERERIVQRQVQLNALLQASQTALAAASAIQTISQAGTLSGPAAPVVIAATVAALAAGFSTISGLATAFRGFKTGGYTGDGDTGAAAGIVHGKEFVMTAEKTAKYRPLLEAIHTGTIEKAYPVYNNYASRTEMKETNKRLDTLIELATFSGTEVKNMVSGGDLVTVTTKHAQRDRNRFKR